MIKLKKLISLTSAVCIAATGTIVTGLMETTASAAAADMESCLNTKNSYAPTSMGVATSAVSGSFSSATQVGTGSKPENTLGGDGSVKEYFRYSGTTGSAKKDRAVSRIALRGCQCGTSYDSSKAKILHVGWTMENYTGSAIDLLYTYNYNGASDENGVTFIEWDSNQTDSDGNMLMKSGGNNYEYQAYVNPESYHADWFIDCENSTYRLYIDNIFFAEGSLSNASGNYYLKNLYFRVPVSTTYNYKISDLVYMTYIPTEINDETVTPTMDDVVAYTLTKDTSRSYWWPTSCRNDGYYWQVAGIGNIGGTAGNRLVGNTSGFNSPTTNVSGTDYVITAASSGSDYSGVGWRFRTLPSNGTNQAKGCLPQDAVNNNVIKQSVTITPNLTSGKSGGIGFRGNNSKQMARYTFNSDKGYTNGTAYNFDIITTCGHDGSSYYYDSYIVVDGKLKWHGVTATQGYLSEVIYSLQDTTGNDTLTLSNMTTTMYDSTKSVYDILEQEVTEELYATVSAGSVSGTTLSCTADVIGAEEILGNTTGKLIFAAFDSSNRFLSSDVADFTTESLNGGSVNGSLDLSSVASSDTITVKAFLWNALNRATPLSNVGSATKSYTVE